MNECWVRYSQDGRWVRCHTRDEARLSASATDHASPVVPLDGGRSEVQWSCNDGNGNDRTRTWAGQVISRYTDASPEPLARSVWCYKPQKGQWTPFAPADDEVLEQMFREMLRMQQISPALERMLQQQHQASTLTAANATYDIAAAGTPDALASAAAAAATAAATTGASVVHATLDGRFRVQLSKDGKGGVYAEMRSTDSNWRGASALSCSVSRGWAGVCARQSRPRSLA